MAGSQEGGDQLTGDAFVEMDRQVAILVVESVKQRELL